MAEITNIKLGNKIIILWNGKIKKLAQEKVKSSGNVSKCHWWTGQAKIKKYTGREAIIQAAFQNVTDDIIWAGQWWWNPSKTS